MRDVSTRISRLSLKMPLHRQAPRGGESNFGEVGKMKANTLYDLKYRLLDESPSYFIHGRY